MNGGGQIGIVNARLLDEFGKFTLMGIKQAAIVTLVNIDKDAFQVFIGANAAAQLTGRRRGLDDLLHRWKLDGVASFGATLMPVAFYNWIVFLLEKDEGVFCEYFRKEL